MVWLSPRKDPYFETFIFFCSTQISRIQLVKFLQKTSNNFLPLFNRCHAFQATMTLIFIFVKHKQRSMFRSHATRCTSVKS